MGKIENQGVFTTGGVTNIDRSAVGHGASVRVEALTKSKGDAAGRAGIGIVTVLAVEMDAVARELGLSREAGRAGDVLYRGRIGSGPESVEVCAIRASGQGQRAIMSALGVLHHDSAPSTYVLAGIGGGLHADVSLGDVVVATTVVYYDLRKETAGGTRRRGEERRAPTPTVDAVNAFFTEHGDPAVIEAAGEPRFRMLCGPIGSGEAVIADADSDARNYLVAYNDKILAVDMESGGFAQFCSQTPDSSAAPGWVVVRGISDYADSTKNDGWHTAASANAARAVRILLTRLARSGAARVT